MPAVLCPSHNPMYLSAFPSWKGKQPLRFFLLEQLLEARKESSFPTNGAGADEDVNVFLAGLLTDFLAAGQRSELESGAIPLFQPPAKSHSRRQRAAFYLTNAHSRLLHLGLFGRGDHLSRRAVPFGFEPAEVRARDLSAGKWCYQAAHCLLKGRSVVNDGVLAVWHKLAVHFEEYVQVLTVLATRRLGLGAQLTESQLNRLLTESGEKEGAEPTGTAENGPQQAMAAMDVLLDLVLEHGVEPGRQVRSRMSYLAGQAGADLEKVLTAGSEG